MKKATETRVQRRLPKEQRRRQLLETSRLIVREEGADRLTLGHLADRAGVSKPVVYDHFETRSALLIALYRWIDTEVVNSFSEAMSKSTLGLTETVDILAATYIKCAADMDGEFQAVGAALAGSEEKAEVFQGLLDNCVEMFVSVLKPHSTFPHVALETLCIGFVGAGEALAGALVRKKIGEAEAIKTFSVLMEAALRNKG
jgi:AcrR family transcriptional regulator